MLGGAASFAVLGSFGFSLTDPIARSLGLRSSTPTRPPQVLRVVAQDPLIGFEAPPMPDRRYFVPLRAPDGSATLLRLASDSGDTMDAAAIDWHIASP